MAGRPRGVTAKRDDLLVVWILKRLQWSDRRIACLLGRSASTIPVWHKAAVDLINTDDGVEGLGLSLHYGPRARVFTTREPTYWPRKLGVNLVQLAQSI